MLAVNYLLYLYNEFLIQRLLSEHSQSGNVALQNVSSTILSTVLSFGKQRQHRPVIHRDFMWIVSKYLFLGTHALLTLIILCYYHYFQNCSAWFQSPQLNSIQALLYGISSASVLVKSLRNPTGNAFQFQGSKSELIRNISVFISQLESAGRPGDASFGLCKRAGKAFSNILDEVIDPLFIARGAESDGFATAITQDSIAAGDLSWLDSVDLGLSIDQWLI